MAWYKAYKGKLAFWVSSLLAGEDWLDHGITMACQDEDPFFNLGFSVEENGEQVAARRGLVAEAFGVPPAAWTGVRQVHGDQVVWVEYAGGDGHVAAPVTYQEEADGLATTAPGLLLATMHADCVPILLADPVRRVVAAVHAGWKGTALAIVQRALTVMRERAGSDPRDCLAAIGPAAGSCCYQVGAELAEKFAHVLSITGLDFTPRLDLPEINRRLLLAAGLPEERVDKALFCTICGGKSFFSHRRQGSCSGRMASLIIRRS